MNSISFTTKINHKAGIHARPSAKIANISAKYKSTITIKNNTEEANAKEILQVLTMGTQYLSTITITATGIDAQEAINELKALIDNNFYMTEE